MIIALAGNQNSGKTTLFNALTGASQHVGNFPGVTVEQKSGEVRRQKNMTVVDLPGIYSLRPFSGEELLTRDFILNDKPDIILNIVDATNLERNLYLTLQLMEMRVPMVLALNMMDELRGNGGAVDIPRLTEALGIPAVPISAVKKEGIDDLLLTVIAAAKDRTLPRIQDFCSKGPVHRCIHAVSHLIEDHAEREGISRRFAAVKLIEGDSLMAERLNLNQNEKELLEHSVREMEADAGLDRNAALADMRYAFIEKAAAAAVTRPQESRERRRSVQIDRVLTGKYTALPAFVLLMALVFYLTFGVVGARLRDVLALGIAALTDAAAIALTAYGINPVVRSLVLDGIFGGVGSVLSFLPVIITLFFFLSILEDTGYMARVAFVMDRLLRRIGLSGRSFVPMLIGFGCSVPAIMATRTLSSRRDRRLTILLTPFMSCSAKIPVYALFTAAFFACNQALVMTGLYFIGILMAVLMALIMKKTVFRGKPVPFVLELPNYRFPSLRTVALLMWEKGRDFLRRAFTVIFISTIVIWFLRTFDARLNVAPDGSGSLLAAIGQFIAPVFRPLGFEDWRAATALITGFVAKEAVVSTLGVLMAGAPLPSLFSLAAAVSFLVFTLLYTPCVAAVATVRRELHSGWGAAAVVVMQCVVAWVAALAAYRLTVLL
jgi:ferrous iron transport protein B